VHGPRIEGLARERRTTREGLRVERPRGTPRRCNDPPHGADRARRCHDDERTCFSAMRSSRANEGPSTPGHLHVEDDERGGSLCIIPSARRHHVPRPRGNRSRGVARARPRGSPRRRSTTSTAVGCAYCHTPVEQAAYRAASGTSPRSAGEPREAAYRRTGMRVLTLGVCPRCCWRPAAPRQSPTPCPRRSRWPSSSTGSWPRADGFSFCDPDFYPHRACRRERSGECEDRRDPSGRRDYAAITKRPAPTRSRVCEWKALRALPLTPVKAARSSRRLHFAYRSTGPRARHPTRSRAESRSKASSTSSAGRHQQAHRHRTASLSLWPRARTRIATTERRCRGGGPAHRDVVWTQDAHGARVTRTLVAMGSTRTGHATKSCAWCSRTDAPVSLARAPTADERQRR